MPTYHDSERRKRREMKLAALAEVQRLYPNFLINLTAQHPALNEQDCDVCVLVILKYDNDAIAESLDVEPHTVENLKTRIKSKIGVGKNLSLYSYLLQLGIAIPPPDELTL